MLDSNVFMDIVSLPISPLPRGLMVRQAWGWNRPRKVGMAVCAEILTTGGDPIKRVNKTQK